MNEIKKTRFRKSLQVATFFIVVIWVIHLIHVFFNLHLYRYGILPQSIEGIKGIFLSPFIHSQSKWLHIINNSPPLFVGLFLLFYFYPSVANRTLLFIYLFTGFFVWIIAGYFLDAKYSYHIGASGVVYGLISFLFFSGFFRRNIRSVVLALIMVLLYSGMIVGLFPDAKGEVSWQSHFVGGIIGMLLAFQYRNIIEPDELQFFEEDELEDNNEKRTFLDPHTFEKTKKEREEEQQNFWSWTSHSTWKNNEKKDDLP